MGTSGGEFLDRNSIIVPHQKTPHLKMMLGRRSFSFEKKACLGGDVKLGRVMSVASSKNTLWFQKLSETASCH